MISIIIYLPSGIGDGDGQGKMQLKAVEQAEFFEVTLLWPVLSQNIKALEIEIQDAHGFWLEDGEIVGLTNAVSLCQVSSVHGCEAVVFITKPFPVGSKIEKYTLH